MRHSPAIAVAIAVAIAATGCVAPGARVEEPGPSVGLQAPTFAPLESATTPDPGSATPTTAPATTPSPGQGAVPTGPDRPSETDPSPSEPPTTTPSAAPSTPPDSDPTATVVRGTLTDGTGDMAGPQASRSPAYADLARVVLERGPERSTIRIAFAVPAPEQGPDGEYVNVATYHDITGDGQVDYEIWASLTSDGWGTSWWDMRAGTVKFAADDDVDVEVQDGHVVLTFPTSHLGGAASGRWLASSEWVSDLSLAGQADATDDTPDDRSGAAWG